MYYDRYFFLILISLFTFSGIDIIAILESLHFSESVISVLRDSSAGYFAVAYALYKIFTPVLYTVTLCTPCNFDVTFFGLCKNN